MESKLTAKYYLIRAFTDHMRPREVCSPDGEQFYQTLSTLVSQFKVRRVELFICNDFLFYSFPKMSKMVRIAN